MQTLTRSNINAVEIRRTYRFRLVMLSLGLFVAPVVGFFAWVDLFPAIIRFSFAVTFLAFGGVVIVMPYDLITNHPILIVDDYGIKIGHKGIHIPWQDIEGCDLFYLLPNSPSPSKGGQMLGLKIKPDSPARMKLSWLNRFFATYGTISKKYPFSISMEGVNMPPMEILQLLNSRRLQYSYANSNS